MSILPCKDQARSWRHRPGSNCPFQGRIRSTDLTLTGLSPRPRQHPCDSATLFLRIVPFPRPQTPVVLQRREMSISHSLSFQSMRPTTRLAACVPASLALPWGPRCLRPKCKKNGHHRGQSSEPGVPKRGLRVVGKRRLMSAKRVPLRWNATLSSG
jgi:hypothetical protein